MQLLLCLLVVVGSCYYNLNTWLLLGGGLIAAYVLWSTVGKQWALDKAGDIADRFNSDSKFRGQMESAVKPLWDASGKEMPKSLFTISRLSI